MGMLKEWKYGANQVKIRSDSCTTIEFLVVYDEALLKVKLSFGEFNI